MRHLIPAICIALAPSSIAVAGVVDVVTFTNRIEWRDSATDPDFALFPANWEVFFRTDNMKDVPIVNGVASGGNGWSAWTATSSSGEIWSTGIGIYSMPAGSSIVIDFNGPVGRNFSGLRGIGGGFQFFDANGAFVPGRIWLKLSNGASIFRNFNTETAFVGFWLTDPTLTITGLTIEPAGIAAAANFAGIDTLYLGYAGSPTSDTDTDGDGRPDSTDNCPAIANPTQADCNTNGIGDACELAAGAPDCNANTIPDSCDIASGASNDVDGNGIPDECKADCNSNGLPDAWEVSQGTVTDCNTNSIPDSCEVDSDADGTINACDGCPNDAAKIAPGACGCGVVETDTDSDSDGTADCVDNDDDNDGVADSADAFPLDASESVDTDGDGTGNNADQDDDGDGADDAADGCPLDANKSAPGQCGCGIPDTDTDSDGIADCVDLGGYLKLINGTDTISLDKSMPLGDSYTYEFRIRFYGLSNPSVNDARLFSEQNGSDTDLAIGFSYSGSTPQISISQCCTAPAIPPTGVSALADSAWHHVAFVRYPTAWRLYVDGELVSSGPSGGAPGSGANANRSIGGFRYAFNNGDPTVQSVTADIDWIRISSVSRYTDIGFTPPSEAMVVADSSTQLLYKFNTLGLTTIMDESPHNVTGIFASGFPSATAPQLVSFVPDADDDGIPDSIDTCPDVAGSPTCNGCPLNVCGECGIALDTDADGIANCIDDDDDNDGVADAVDAFPLDASESVDTDGDGQGNNADQDDDGDGADDASDGCPLDANKSAPGVCGCGNPDTDSDGDSVADCIDNCVAVANPTQDDCDGNGVGEACELFTDCNANNITDSCDIASGFAQDCNGNGKPDSCDIAAGNGSPYPGAVQWTIASGGNGHWYAVQVRLPGVSWEEADVLSRGMDGYLATIGTLAEDEFVFAVSNTPAAWPGILGPWLGAKQASGSQEPSEGWHWTTNEPWTYLEPSNWANNGAGGPEENYLHYMSGRSWNDAYSSGDYGWDRIVAFVVEWPSGLATESDCNSNGVPDSCEIASGAASDCNTNSIPDSCEVDSDTDGTIDGCDGCPNDPTKIAAGTCGCGVPETDSDSDGTANCIDDDDDNDGAADSADAFPLDASESADTDGDGQGNNADSDDDNDGADDASDGCPFDTNKTAPGVCGCGNSDTDSDGDGIANCVDNCVAVANPTQDDCDGNGVGEACESFTDCNANSIPDSCDITGGFAQDCNGNGKPDSCDLEGKSSGMVAAWGRNDFGQATVPADLGKCLAIDAGLWGTTVVIKQDHTVQVIGINWYHPETSVVPVDLGPCRAISHGAAHLMAVRVDGGVRVWGGGPGAAGPPPSVVNPQQIACGGYHNLALLADGTVRAWGLNDQGQLDVPIDQAAIAIGGGQSHSLLVSPAGGVHAYGWNDAGQSSPPIDLHGITRVDGGFRHSVALRNDGVVVCWGSNSAGQCDVPLDLGAATDVNAGGKHSVALLANGRVVCWGFNASGACDVPPTLEPCSAIAAGGDDYTGGGHTVVLLRGAESDCNANGIPDSCDITSGTASDCDASGVPDSCESDADADGTIDACDGCPNDPAKIALGACGCGVADTDSDGDGTEDCVDTDDDNDGVEDTLDAFPLDASESVDSDADGQGNNSDTDDDNDGADDASDGCPLDASKTAPGQCGCGVVDTDGDGDGIADCVDNCVAIANPTQADCNGNGVGDACEPAPVTTVTAKLWGAAGGPNRCCDGWITGGTIDCGTTGIAGGYVNASFDNITPGSTLYIYVGQGGSFNGLTNTFGGGGRAGSTGGGSGGGASFISLVPEPTEDQSGMLLAVAGGGAGGANPSSINDVLGNGGGSTGAMGHISPAGGVAATGGTQASGGTSATGGYGGGGEAGSPGQFLQGGFGMGCAGGGGGGGLYGGGGGHGDCGHCSDGIGGGGSSFVNVAFGAVIHHNDQGIRQSVHPNASADPDWANNAGNGINGSGNSGRVVLIINNVRYIFNYTGSVQTFIVPSVNADCNSNGIPDSCEIASGAAGDCNANSIPDSCEVDSDSDGTIDVCDGCPNDPAKIAEGACGCGVADTDTDSDGTANCFDDDDDNDGVADYADAFPLDASESVDTDGDGQGNNVDADDDNDGADDASDGCPFDPNKTSPGVCGCGNPDTDSDGDGIANCIDNCVAVANPTQDDCDGNGIGEACESFTDCNANSIPDSCDITSGFAQDCNGNGKPDSCDIAAGNSSPYPGAVQWTVASGGNGHWYARYGVGSTWENARTVALANGANLAAITSDAENTFIRDALMPPNGTWWIGGYQGSDLAWRWMSGDAWNFTSWDAGQPDGATEQRIVMSSNGTWFDAQSDEYWWIDSIFEWSATESDCNANGIPDSCDINSGVDADCNNDGILNSCEIAAGGLDCNGNGIPDTCDVGSGGAAIDCNANGIPDSCDITSGASMDCNANAIPDSCDIATGASRDVDTNGVPDECKPDCNNNDLPDAWEIAQGLVPDCNHNGIPDACENDWRDANTGNMGRFGNGVPATGTLSGMVTTTTAVTVRVEAVGDLGAATEYATLKLGQSVVGTLLFQTSGRDCPATPDVATLTLTKAQWNAIVASAGLSGDVEVTLSGSPLVDATQCGGAGMSYVSVIYGGPAYDCDANGLSDLCEVGTGARDCNNNSILDACELLSGSAPDIDANGVIDSCQTDCNSNGLPDTYELTQGLVSDCNGNGIPDSCDLVNGAADCNGNGVIDSCDLSSSFALDCNGNSVPDSCDINSGISIDCNTNGVPDSCDIAINTAPDCNANGVPDSCDVAAHTVPDCNTNGVPDSCDVASGASNDVDSNGIPDECKTDCNGNGLPDAWEISQGTAPDCNLNFIPDSCDLTSGAAADCNNNGVPDSCDITNGAIDKDANGQPDDCQYAHGDFDLSGDIGGGDLGFLLAVWGTNSIIGDLDGDHIIGGGDLGTLLSRWGPVQ